MSKLVRALCCFIICLQLPAAGATADQVDLERLGNSVFQIEARDDSGRLHSGSGVMVSPHTLVTNCHTVLNARDISVAGSTGRVPARLVRANIERDLCLLDAPSLRGPVATLGTTTDKGAGEPIVAIGYPAGAALTVSRGHIEGLFTYHGAGRVIQGSAYFGPGKSGGGLFDKHGSLIGILTFKCRAGGPYHFAVPVEWVATLMHDAPGTVQAFTEKPFWQHTDERQPVFLRAASLFAEGNCVALNALAAQWLARDPDNPEARFIAKRAQRCDMLTQIQRPLLEK